MISPFRLTSFLPHPLRHVQYNSTANFFIGEFNHPAMVHHVNVFTSYRTGSDWAFVTLQSHVVLRDFLVRCRAGRGDSRAKRCKIHSLHPAGCRTGRRNPSPNHCRGGIVWVRKPALSSQG